MSKTKISPTRQIYLLIAVLLVAAALAFGHFSTNQPRLEKAPLISSNNVLSGAILGKDDEEEPLPPPPPPSYFKGKVISPDWAVSSEDEYLIEIPLFGQYQVNWSLNSFGQSIYTSSCQIRLDNERVAGVGYSGNLTLDAEKVTRSRRTSEGADANLYCLLKNDTRDPVPVDPYVNTGISDLEVSINNCETSFDGILWGFANSLVFPVRITEDGFQKWAENDSFDRCEYGFGDGDNLECTRLPDGTGTARSGDRYDIETAMEGYQCSSLSIEQFVDGLLSGQIIVGARVLDQLMSLTNLNRPVPLVFVSLDSSQIRGHAVVVLKASKTTTSGLEYKLDVLDPGGPNVVGGVTCSNQRVDTGEGIMTLLVCDYPTGRMIPISTSLLALAQNLNQRFSSKCSTYTNLRICQERKDNMSGWLKSNYPAIPNYAPPGSPGICYGWVTFVLQATYLGDFVGECPHP